MKINKRFFIILLIIGFILLIPFIAMRFTNQVNWEAFDFLVMGAVLLSAGILAEFVLRQVRNTEYRIGILAILFILFLLIWAELAVGIFGSPFAGS
ncbi:hypothetical protein [Psychroflexus sediminis]|uniref:Uncharacterized protein n=1 Tax=Psychroflexus sediminis TaxID=470826 RepID=A0A1G7W8A4_9FLAO|nr:hypothetical protein [Psychroflexus sediminis]SDG68235.1 hypothetical protein SAMN04488027_10561 [Psychroflexus sediminis]